MNEEPEGEIIGGLAERVRSLLLGLDRLDRLETAGEFVDWLQRQERAQLDGFAHGMFLRVLSCFGDPVNHRILERLDLANAVGSSELTAVAGLDRVALSERLNDLMQVGLISRDMIDDQVRATTLAVGLRALVDRIAVEAGGKLLAGLSDQGQAGTS